MSEENVEIVRSFYEAFNRGDWDAMFRDAHPDFELTTPSQLPNAGTYRGREECQRFLQDGLAAFEASIVEPEVFFESGDRSSPSTRIACGPRTAARRLRTGTDSSGPSARARSSPCSSSPTPTTPSKPPAWRSRRCRRENVELLHKGVAAWNRRDLDGYLELMDPDD